MADYQENEEGTPTKVSSFFTAYEVLCPVCIKQLLDNDGIGILVADASCKETRAVKRFHIHFYLIAFVLAAVAVNQFAAAQMTRSDSIWQPLKVFVGNWEGKGGGEPGIGDYTRSYRFVLNNKYIEIKNKSVYPAAEKNPKGEVHEDWGYFSYDKTRKTFVLRQFHVEGFVNQYKLASISEDGRKIVFVSEAIENIPSGWRAKETYDILNDHQIQETFELAEPNKEFEVYTKVVLNRVPDASTPTQ